MRRKTKGSKALAIILTFTLVLSVNVPMVAWGEDGVAAPGDLVADQTAMSDKDAYEAGATEEANTAEENPQPTAPLAPQTPDAAQDAQVASTSSDTAPAGETPTDEAAVAKVGEVGYATLAEAVTAAKAGETVTLLADAKIDATLVLDKAITVGGAGYAVQADDLNPAIKITTNDAVAFSNLTLNGAKRGIDLIAAGAQVALTQCTFNVVDRGITMSSGAYDNVSLALDATALNCTRVSDYEKEAALDQNCRGISLWNIKNSQVTLRNGSSLNGFSYSINVSGDADPQSGVADTAGLVVTVDNSTIRGWTGMNVWGSLGTYNIMNSTIKGVNTSSAATNSFAALVFNDDIYDLFENAHAENNTLNISDSTITNYQGGSAVEELLRIDSGITKLNLSGIVNFIDTSGNIPTALYLVHMEDPFLFLSKSVVVEPDTTVNCTTVDGKPLPFAPSYVAWYYWDNEAGGYDGCYVADIADVFESKSGYTLCNGEYLDLVADATLSGDVTVALKSGESFTFNRKTFGVSGGAVVIPEGVAVKTDAVNNGIFKASEGCRLVESVEDGVYTYTSMKAVAQIGNTYYDTLAKAVDAAQAGDTVKLLADVDLGTLSKPTTDTGLLTIESGKQITLDLAGFSITSSLETDGSTYFMAHTILNKGSLTIADTSSSATGSIVNSNAASNACTRTVKNIEGASLELKGGSIVATSGVGLLNLGSCTISGEGVVVEASRAGITGGWDNGVAAVENRTNGVLKVSAGTLRSVSQSALFADGGQAAISGGTLIGSTTYGAMNGDPEYYVTVVGGLFSSDPSACVDATSYLIGRTAEGLYEVKEAAAMQELAISNDTELIAALTNADPAAPKNLIISNAIKLSSTRLSLPSTYRITINTGGSLEVSENAILTLDGLLQNDGTLSVSSNGFIANPKNVSGNTLTGVAEISQGIYTVSTPMDLQWLGVLLDAGAQSSITKVELANDIAMPAGIVFQSLGSANSIVFDGQNHTISGLVLSSIGGYSGLFELLSYSTVRNVSLANCNYTTVNGYLGGLVGQANGCLFEKVNVSGSIVATGASYGVAGIAASVYNSSSTAKTEFVDCRNTATVGGLAAYNVGSMFGTASGAPGLIGVYNCSNGGAITAAGSVGYVCGFGYMNSAATFEVIGFNHQGGTVNNVEGTLCSALGSGFTIKTNYAGSDYVAVRNAEGNWTTAFAEMTIDGVATAYGDPQRFITDLVGATGKTIGIKMLADTVVDGYIPVAVDQTVTLDMNGKSLSSSYAGSFIRNQGSLTISGNGSLFTTDVAAQGRHTIENYGNLVIENGSFGSKASRGNAVRNYGTALIKGGLFTACDNYTNGGYAYAVANGNSQYPNASMVIEDATVQGKMNGVIACDGGQLVVKGGTYSLGDGAANNLYYMAYSSGSGVVKIEGGSFTRNVKNNGSFFYGTVSISGGEFEDAVNTTIAATGSVDISGGTFKNGISAASPDIIKVTGGTFTADPSAYVAEGYVTTGGEGSYTIQKAVAKSGSTYYLSLQDALNKVDNGATVTLMGESTADTSLIASKAVTIDGGGYRISGTLTGSNVGNISIKNATFATAPNLTLAASSAATFSSCVFDKANGLSKKNAAATVTGGALAFRNCSFAGAEGSDQSVGIQTWNAESVEVSGCSFTGYTGTPVTLSGNKGPLSVINNVITGWGTAAGTSDYLQGRAMRLDMQNAAAGSKVVVTGNKMMNDSFDAQKSESFIKLTGPNVAAADVAITNNYWNALDPNTATAIANGETGDTNAVSITQYEGSGTLTLYPYYQDAAMTTLVTSPTEQKTESEVISGALGEVKDTETAKAAANAMASASQETKDALAKDPEAVANIANAEDTLVKDTDSKVGVTTVTGSASTTTTVTGAALTAAAVGSTEKVKAQLSVEESQLPVDKQMPENAAKPAVFDIELHVVNESGEKVAESVQPTAPLTLKLKVAAGIDPQKLVVYSFHGTNAQPEMYSNALGNLTVAYDIDGYYATLTLSKLSYVVMAEDSGTFEVATYKPSEDPATWTAPAAPSADQVFAGWYTDSTCATVYTATTGKAYAKFAPLSSIITFKGGSLRMEDDATVATSLRFGYTITMPEGLSFVDAGWTATGMDSSGNPWSGTVRATNKVVSDTGFIETNLLLLNVKKNYYAQTWSSTMDVTYKTADGTLVTAVEPKADQRSIQNVATYITASNTATAVEKEYAQKILNAIEGN
ncbi:MAG: hypothetical protein VB027_02585 [Gordonibacter sp.]|nr:hypothetical protein [Gordonibacter sp.]